MPVPDAPTWCSSHFVETCPVSALVVAEAVPELVVDEHLAFCELASSLTDEDWAAPSMCQGWTARDVVIHVADHIHRTGLEAVSALARSGFSPTKSTQQVVDRHRQLPVGQLLEWLSFPVRAPSAVQLSEIVIHHQDIRRSLYRERQMPTSVAIACLEFGLSRKGNAAVAGARTRASGLRLVATDTDWTHGTGAEVSGPVEALLMALNGRGAATTELSGEGVATIRDRSNPTSHSR